MNPSENVRPSLPSQEETLALADLFKIFGDTTRIQIMFRFFTPLRMSMSTPS